VQRHRFFISFFGTVLLYLTVGLLFFYTLHQTIGTEQKPQEKIITFTLSEYVPEVISPVEPPMKTPEEEPIAVEEVVEPVAEEPIIEEPEPEEPVIEEVIPEPIKPKVVPKPVVKKIVKKKVKKKVIKKKRVKKKTVRKRVTKRKATTKKTSRKKHASKRQASPAKKNAFLSRIRSKINKAKTYPRIAQRRGMQGSVKVRFTILKSGNVGNIQVSGKKVFYKSARAAIKKAFPISTKNIPMSLPQTVNLTIRYQIR